MLNVCFLLSKTEYLTPYETKSENDTLMFPSWSIKYLDTTSKQRWDRIASSLTQAGAFEPSQEYSLNIYRIIDSSQEYSAQTLQRASSSHTASLLSQERSSPCLP